MKTITSLSKLSALITIVSPLALVFLSITLLGSATPTELFFPEHVEGSSYNLGHGESTDGDGTENVASDDKEYHIYLPLVLDLPLITTIYEIQYTDDPSGDSPYESEVVTTEGVVIALYSDGYVIEDAGRGPWSGLFVYDSSHTPALGQLVWITGTVQEYYSMTELADVTGLTVVLSGYPLPDPEVVLTGDAGQEQYEGVLLQVQGVTVTDPDLGFGEWEVDDDSGPVRVDDKGYHYTPTAGERLVYVTGPLFYTLDNFKLEPRDADDVLRASDVVITEVLYDVSGDDDSYEWVEIYNRGSSPVHLSTFSLGNGGNDYTFSLVPLCGVIGPGQYFIVGGPLQSGDNGSPIYSEPYNFDPDFQDSGLTADGVALFDVPADQVTPSTVPVDAVIYGVENTNDLIDETGNAPAPHVGDAPANNSIQLDLATDTWFIALPDPATDPVQPPCTPDGLAPFETFEIHRALISWQEQMGDRGYLTARGELELPEGYTPHDLTRDLEFTLTISQNSASHMVSLKEYKHMWFFHDNLQPPLEGVQLTKVQIHWPKPGDASLPTFDLHARFYMPGVSYETRPAEATVGLRLPVTTDPPTEQIVGEETIVFRPRRRLWMFK